MQNNGENRIYAGFFVRLVAFLFDILIVGTGLLAIRIPVWILAFSDSDNFLVKDFIFQYSIMNIVTYLITVTYFVLFTYYTGSTLGKKLFHLRVVSVENRKITLFEVIYRESIGRFLSSVVMNLGYLLILIEKDKRGVHDLMSDTCVVYYHEKKVYVHAPMHYRNMNQTNENRNLDLVANQNTSAENKQPENSPIQVSGMGQGYFQEENTSQTWNATQMTKDFSSEKTVSGTIIEKEESEHL